MDEIKEDLNIGIVLQYTLNPDHHSEINTDTLVRQARDSGFRGVSIENADELQRKLMAEACEKYAIKFCQTRPAISLQGPDVLAKLIAARLDGYNIYFKVALTADGKIAENEIPDLDILRQWLDRFGHAYYEARPDHEITTTANASIFRNNIANYQIYVFIHQPLASTITLHHVPELKTIMWIDTRKELNFKQKGDEVTIELQRDPDDAEFTIYGLRLQAHRPEDDIKETKY